MPHSAILNTRPMSAPSARLEANAADRHIRAIDEARARQDHEDFVTLVEDEILPAMRAFEVLLHFNRVGCRIDTQDLRSRDAFRSTSRIALHILLENHSDEGPAPPPRLECVRSRRHPGEVILVTSGRPGEGSTSGQMRRYDQVTYGLVFDLLDRLLAQLVTEPGEFGSQQAPG